MRQLGLLLLMIVLLIAAWAVIAPVRHTNTEDKLHSADSNKISDNTYKPHNKQVTFQQVSEKSQAALVTTAAYVQQEKNKLRARMGVTLRKLDQEIARLQATTQTDTSNVKPEAQGTARQRLVDLQGAKQTLLQLQSSVPTATQATWNRIKANWNRLEPDINARIQS